MSETRDRGFVQSLERGLSVIRALGEPGDGKTLADVARDTGLTRAAARRFLLTLVELGYARSNDRHFMLTPRTLELGYSYLSSLGLPEVAAPHLQAIVERIHESSSVSVLDGEEIVYVARAPTRRIMSVAINVGTRLPAHLTSMGRVLLAHSSDLEQRLEALELDRHTERTIGSVAELRRELDKVREQGFAIVDQELEPGLRSVGAPIRTPAGSVVAAVNISTHASRTTLERVRRELLPALLEAAEAIGDELRAVDPH